MPDYGPTEPAPRCEAHDGQHALYMGACLAVGAQVTRPTAWRRHALSCPDCGAELDAARIGSRALLVDSGTTRRHHHTPDRAGERLEAVTDGLAALQDTLAQMLTDRLRSEERRQSTPRREPAPETPPAPPPPRRVVE